MDDLKDLFAENVINFDELETVSTTAPSSAASDSNNKLSEWGSENEDGKSATSPSSWTWTQGDSKQKTKEQVQKEQINLKKKIDFESKLEDLLVSKNQEWWNNLWLEEVIRDEAMSWDL